MPYSTNKPLAFPYPKIGNVKREAGKGCSSCVHKKYCVAFYWFIRNASKPSVSGKNTDTVDKHLGIQCESWSDDPNDIVRNHTEGDAEYHEMLADREEILIEPFDSGLDGDVTAGYREH